MTKEKLERKLREVSNVMKYIIQSEFEYALNQFWCRIVSRKVHDSQAKP